MLQAQRSLLASRRNQALKKKHVLLQGGILQFERPYPVEQSLLCRTLQQNRVSVGACGRAKTQQFFVKMANLETQRLQFRLHRPGVVRLQCQVSQHQDNQSDQGAAGSVPRPGNVSPHDDSRRGDAEAPPELLDPQEMVIPSRRERAGEFHLEVRNLLRKEGSFESPAGARLQSVEARILQGDTLRAKRLAQL